MKLMCVVMLHVTQDTAPGTVCFNGYQIHATDARCKADGNIPKNYCDIDRPLHCHADETPNQCSDEYLVCAGGQLHKIPVAAGTKCFNGMPVHASSEECNPTDGR